jgi:hypothetical protein
LRGALAFAQRAALVVLVVYGCTDVVRVHLAVSGNGFLCQTPDNPSGPFLIQRALTLGQTTRISLVVDFIQLGGQPDCRLPGIVGWCKSHSCAPVVTARSCFSIDLTQPISAQAPVDQLVRAALSPLTGTQVSPDAPVGPVLVRLVGTTQTCDEVRAGGVSQPFDSEKLFGCAHSCPVRLDSVGPDLLLDIDFLPRTMDDRDCAPIVFWCATPDLVPPT